MESQLREFTNNLAEASKKSTELMRQRDNSWLQLNNFKDQLLDSERTIKSLLETRKDL
jgi:hypothetical protein